MQAQGQNDSQISRLLEAIGALGSNLSLADVLRRIVEVACNVVEAEFGALGVLDESREELSEFIHIGLDHETAKSIGPLPHGKGILGRLITNPEPLRLPHLKAHPDSYGFPNHHPDMDSFLGVPIVIRGEVFGNLYLTNKRTANEFSEDDEQFAIALATAAGTFIENSRLHEKVKDVAIVEDRERIARDLHDLVIQRLFAVGLTVQSLMRSVPEEARGKLAMIVEELDNTVRQIRTTIFSLERSDDSNDSLRAKIIDVVNRGTAGSSIEPSVQFDGPIDTLVNVDVSENLLAVAEEALSNVVRHSGATVLDIKVSVDKNRGVVLRFSDNGMGINGDSFSGNGLRNMEKRALAFEGTFSCESLSSGGTELVWAIPYAALN